MPGDPHGQPPSTPKQHLLCPWVKAKRSTYAANLPATPERELAKFCLRHVIWHRGNFLMRPSFQAVTVTPVGGPLCGRPALVNAAAHTAAAALPRLGGRELGTVGVAHADELVVVDGLLLDEALRHLVD